MNYFQKNYLYLEYKKHQLKADVFLLRINIIITMIMFIVIIIPYFLITYLDNQKLNEPLQL